MYTLAEGDIGSNHSFSDADMLELNDRWDEYLLGKEESLTLEEAKNDINEYIERKKKSAQY